MTNKQKEYEEDIQRKMNILDLTREQAEELYKFDKEVDKMRDSQVNNDLTAEQQKTVKKMRKQEVRKPTVYKFQNRAKKSDNTKANIILSIAETLSKIADEPIEIANPEREINFTVENRKFKVVLSAPRK